MKFEWDPRKAAENLRKHRISFDEASTAFGDPFSRANDLASLSGRSDVGPMESSARVERRGGP